MERSLPLTLMLVTFPAEIFCASSEMGISCGFFCEPPPTIYEYAVARRSKMRTLQARFAQNESPFGNCGIPPPGPRNGRGGRGGAFFCAGPFCPQFFFGSGI